MNWKLISRTTAAFVIASTAITVAQQPPDVENTTVTIQSVAGSVSSTFDRLVDKHDDAVWVGYSAPLIRGYRVCCGDWDCSQCRCNLEKRRNSYNSRSSDDDIISHGDLIVLVRIENHRIQKIHAFSEDCQLDANGVPFVWLDGVDPSASIAWLSSLVFDPSGKLSYDDVIERAVSATAMHDHPDKLPALERFSSRDQSEELREHVVFWIGASGECSAVEILERILQDDPSSDVREKVTFALTLPECAAATDALFRIAREDRDPDVRGNALFWLANEAGEKARVAIENAIENDPDTDVKEQAVFALSQLPEDEGIPLLIKVARTNRNAEVRKQAIFWLGQSEDARVVDFFEEILTQ